MQLTDMSKATGEGPQVFICYDKTYQERALQLHGLLKKDLQGKFGRGIDVFIDQENLETGEEWDAQIRAALQSARVLIVLVSDGLVTRPYCRFEFNMMRSRIASGEQCFILAVKWQRDSEIYRSAPLSQAQTEKLDGAYLASLSDDERSVVEALRRQQFLDGASLREEPPASERFNAAFLALSAEVARLYRELRVAVPSGGIEAGEDKTPGAGLSPGMAPMAGIVGPAAGGVQHPEPTPDTGRMIRGIPRLAIAGAVVLLAAAVVLAIPSVRQSVFGPGEEITVPPPLPPSETPPVEVAVWQPVDRLVENKSGQDVVAYSDARVEAKPLETLSPGVIRPLVAVKGKVESADISGVTWLSYPTQVPEVRGFVRAKDIEPR